jgi:DNA polymerase
MFIGEGPGRDEDLQGEPFVGRAGQLLTKIIEAMGLKRSDVYIANVVKCRPPENRNPAPDEVATCSPFLLEQIEIIRPKIIVCLGNFAAQTILSTPQTITGLRGRLHRWPSTIQQAVLHTKIPAESIQVMPTYHPAYLLRNPNMKKPVWEDMKIVMGELGK